MFVYFGELKARTVSLSLCGFISIFREKSLLNIKDIFSYQNLLKNYQKFIYIGIVKKCIKNESLSAKRQTILKPHVDS